MMFFDLNVAHSIYASINIASQFVRECRILVEIFSHLQLAISCSACVNFPIFQPETLFQ